MLSIRSGLALCGLTLAAACTRTVIVRERPQPRQEAPPPPPNTGPSTARTIGIPPGHLPQPGQCRIWIPGTPPGRQPGRRSRTCVGILREAPAGSWVVYRPLRDRKTVYVREIDRARSGVVITIRLYDVDNGIYIRDGRAEEEEPESKNEPDDRGSRRRPDEARRDGPGSGYGPGQGQGQAQQKDTVQIVVRPEQPPPQQPPPGQPPQQPPPQPPGQERRPDDRGQGQPPVQPPGQARRDSAQGQGQGQQGQPPPGQARRDSAQGQGQGQPPQPPGQERQPATSNLSIPPGHLPQPGQCRIWIPGEAPGQQRSESSRTCASISRDAPAGSWVVYRPTRDRKLVYVRVVDPQRAGVVITVRVFDADDGRYLRDEKPEDSEDPERQQEQPRGRGRNRP
jgi:hypothetical protein